ncbi:SDR family NAD(P)-dependent oxidoreductase [Streptomyces sp. enrichment culture]|uniref:SDR family NAD(P)-dependent oxidoreductase n=1 Tax=Streptomyces sp. enrichment culture TaxID=1795815 RepID=UPI003F56FBEF
MEANRALVEFAQQQYGGVDIAFLNAGVATGCGIGEDFDPARYRRAMGANLDGVVFGTHAVLPALRARGGGAIVATASLAGLAAVPLDPLYAANKHAVVGLARSLGPALAPHNVRFNAVCPGVRRVTDHRPPARHALRAGNADHPGRGRGGHGAADRHRRRHRGVLVHPGKPVGV